MVRILSLTALALALLAFPTADSAHGDGRCKVADLEGSWGLVFTGTLFIAPPGLAGPATLVGAFTVDKAGNFFGQDTTSANGTVFEETFTGSATLSADCTGSATVTASVAGVSHFDVVLVANKLELLIIRTDPGTVVSGSAKRQ
jgi:hypothetical protein